MIPFTDLTGLASVAIAMAASAFFVLNRLLHGQLSTRHGTILVGTMFVLMLIPFSGMPLAAYPRGVTGDLSITTLVLLGCVLLKPGFSVADAQSHRALLLLIALAAFLLYPMALGVGAFDPYRLGYSDPLFVTALLLMTLAAWFLKFDLIVLSILLATLAWACGWYESDNLWDYLLDPFVSVYALVAVVHQLWQRSRSYKSQSHLPE